MIYRHSKYGGTETNEPKLIVIHCMAEYVKDTNEQYLYAPDFLNKYKLSAHSLITPEGDNIRLRDDSETAWHARGFNQDSLGIEFLVQGKHDYQSFIDAIKSYYVTDEQWEAGLTQVREWIKSFNIQEITMHSTLSPGRKVDPGKGFNFERFIQEI